MTLFLTPNRRSIQPGAPDEQLINVQKPIGRQAVARESPKRPKKQNLVSNKVFPPALKPRVSQAIELNTTSMWVARTKNLPICSRKA